MSLWSRVRGALKAGLNDGYEGGKRNRRTAGFVPAIRRTADLEIDLDWELITARGRWLGRNNPWCAGGKATVVDNILGKGTRTRATVRDVNNRLMSDWNREANRLYEQVLDQLDHHGRQHWYQMTRTGLSTAVESGEVFYVERMDLDSFRSGKRLVPLTFELVEPDQLDLSQDRPGSDGVNEIRRGIEFDSAGNRVAYHFYSNHPGALYPTRLFTTERVPSDQVIHLYRQDRPTQTRGVSWFAPIITSLWNLYEYQSSEIDAAKVASYFIYLWKRENPSSDTSGFGIEDADSVAGDVTDLHGNTVEELVPGVGLEGGPNDDLKVIQGNRPNSNSVPWLKLMLQTMGVGLRVGYSKFTGDFSQSSWSSHRAEDLNDQRAFGPAQDWHSWYLDLEVRKRVTRWLIALETLPIPAGGLPRFNRNPQRWLACKSIAPRNGYLNPREEVNADFDAIRYGLSNWDIALAARGLDAQEVHEQAADELGMTIEEYREILKANLAVPGTPGNQQAGTQVSGTESASESD